MFRSRVNVWAIFAGGALLYVFCICVHFRDRRNLCASANYVRCGVTGEMEVEAAADE